MSSSFPNANHTFTVLRPQIGSTVKETIATGLSIYLEPKNQWVDTGKGGQLVTGIYDGVCSKSAGLLVKDILQDENDVNNRGEAVVYEVQECFVDMLFTNLIVHRTDS